MSDDNVVDFASQRDKRIHDLHDKRLEAMRQAFEQSLPLGQKAKGKSAKKPKKPKKR